jgi:hypothetical protein
VALGSPDSSITLCCRKPKHLAGRTCRTNRQDNQLMRILHYKSVRVKRQVQSLLAQSPEFHVSTS